jgi:hypothetical protein
MKAIDLRQTLKSQNKEWLAIDKKSKKIVSRAKSLSVISKKLMD